ncbi:hypothetical protein [Henriciella marina]|uniref:Uncharacterized protein n=1 Tax=Henriciella marina TaxID=453851 RepID=A0ABT4LXY7_9PROT|nr:hypothetical protein [Henriciella marina]MCZ4299227.1 hypothetical protein [Henriciella marina]
MQPLASQTRQPRLEQTATNTGMAPVLAGTTGRVSGKAANDNAGIWKPTLLVQRRRRHNRLAGRV